MSYTDNPNKGEIGNDKYPDYGGAYFDCVGFGKYPEGKVIENLTNENGNGSDSLAKKNYHCKEKFRIYY